jgi:hypothetical protein
MTKMFEAVPLAWLSLDRKTVSKSFPQLPFMAQRLPPPAVLARL